MLKNIRIIIPIIIRISYIMTRRKSGQEQIRKLCKIGGSSTGVTIPVSILRKLGWRTKQKVVVEQEGDQIIISDWKH